MKGSGKEKGDGGADSSHAKKLRQQIWLPHVRGKKFRGGGGRPAHASDASSADSRVEWCRHKNVKTLRHSIRVLVRKAFEDADVTGAREKSAAACLLLFERWVARSMLDDETKGSDDACEPLIPTRDAGRGMYEDIVRGGNQMKPSDVNKLIKEIVAASVKCKSRLLRASSEIHGGAQSSSATVAIAKRGDLLRLSLQGQPKPYFTITRAYFGKLMALYARARGGRPVVTMTNRTNEADKEDYDAFLRAVYCLLARYDALGGDGYQAAISIDTFRILTSHPLRVSCEMFASPLNCTISTFCSAFGDTDRPFGSEGSFFSCIESVQSGSYEVNPPFIDTIIDAVVDRLLARTERDGGAGKALSFVLIIPRWRHLKQWRRLTESPSNVVGEEGSEMVIKSTEHGYNDGARYKNGNAVPMSSSGFRLSSYDTAVFFLQNSAGREEYKVDDKFRERLRASMCRSRGPETTVAELEKRFRHRSARTDDAGDSGKRKAAPSNSDQGQEGAHGNAQMQQQQQADKKHMRFS